MTDKVYSVNKKESGFHHGDLRNALIAAGLAALETSEEPSLRDLARRVGVSPMACYRHFSDGHALRAALADAAFAVFATDVMQAVSSTAALRPQGQLMAICHAYVRFARERPGMFRLIFTTPLDMAKVSDVGTGAAAAFAPLAETVAACQGKPIDSEPVAIGVARVWTAVHGYASLWLSGRLPKHVTQIDPIDQILGPVIDSL